MNKAIISNRGKAEIKEVPMPKLQNESLIIKQVSFGLNYDDIKVLEGKIKNPNSYGILGIEAAGIVTEVGKDCKKDFKVGDRVCYATYHPGSFVKFRNVHENYLIPIPRYLNFEGASTILKGLMAYTLLGKIFVINSPSIVLLSGASGAIGSFVTQIASKAGIKIIALTSNDAKKDYIKSNGAIEAINYKKENTVEIIRSITKGKGVDFFFDCLGLDVTDFAFKVLKTRGFFISFGSITNEFVLNAELNLEMKQKSITFSKVLLGNFITNYNDFMSTSLAYMKSIQAGVVRPFIHTFDFKNPNQAFLDLKNSISTGQKVLLYEE